MPNKSQPARSEVSTAVRLWQRLGHYLPKTVQDRVVAEYRRRNTKLPDRTDHSADDALTAVDAEIRAAAAINRRQGDGMRDYPNTRPLLAFGYLEGLVRFLAESVFTPLSYHDLAEIVPVGHESSEFSNWIRGAEQRQERAILLQYDVDARPDVTARLMQVHIDCGVPGNAMIFNRKIFDWKLKREGVIEYDDSYVIDHPTFEAFQRAGGAIGYHCNAFDRSNGNMERAIEIFHDDIADLRKHHDIRFFSMHGGHVTQAGLCNARIEIEPYLEELGLTWVHNGRSLYFHANWADGSASNPQYRREPNDPLDFLLSTGIGQRARLLFHPQYYNNFDNTHFDFPVLQEQQWIQATRDTVERGNFDGRAYWQERLQVAERECDETEALFHAEGSENPVFIHGMSRSGTTLLTSMFDAHPSGAMAYESYPRYLHVPSDNGVLTMEEFLYAYQTLINYPESTAFSLLDRPPLRNLMRFAAVSSWTGMDNLKVGRVLRSYLRKQHRVTNGIDALKIVAATARYKLRHEGATFWGTKCQGNFSDYLGIWPRARLIYIQRDGLDILVSQMTNGAFNPDPESIGANWRTGYEKFLRCQLENQLTKTAIVRYEELTSDPEATMTALCHEIGLDYHADMIRQHEKETTLTRNPRGQLSAERVKQPVDTSSIGKWRQSLNKADIASFLKGCGGQSYYESRGYSLET